MLQIQFQIERLDDLTFSKGCVSMLFLVWIQRREFSSYFYSSQPWHVFMDGEESESGFDHLGGEVAGVLAGTC